MFFRCLSNHTALKGPEFTVQLVNTIANQSTVKTLVCFQRKAATVLSSIVFDHHLSPPSVVPHSDIFATLLDPADLLTLWMGEQNEKMTFGIPFTAHT
mmetsp:Transcript_11100/g.19339  ORF Transcript_11100/g.19339 Transcript_11100/m.19339 type:complete len:98 (+) Transcript_11100:373-666(+)